MKPVIAIVSVLLFLSCSGCGGDTHESLAGDGLSTMQEMVTLLDGVKDADSAKSAKPKLTSLMEKLNGINEKQSKLPAPTEAEIKAMESKYGKQMEETSRKFQSHMFRIMSNPKIGAEFSDLDSKMMKSMK